MGKYYKNAMETLIFQWGLDEIGPPTQRAALVLPEWDRRAWTLQEEVMAGIRADFVIHIRGAIGYEPSECCRLDCQGLCLGSYSGFSIITRTNSNFASFSSRHGRDEPDQRRHGVQFIPHAGFSSCQNMYMAVTFDWLIPKERRLQAKAHRTVERLCNPGYSRLLPPSNKCTDAERSWTKTCPTALWAC